MIITIPKKWLFLSFLTIFFFHAESTAQENTLQPILSPEFIQKGYAQIHQTKEQLHALMHDILTSVDYWRLLQVAPFRYHLQQNPLEWFASKSVQEELCTKISTLKASLEHHALFLGKLSPFLEELSLEAVQKPEFAAKLVEALNVIRICTSLGSIPETIELPDYTTAELELLFLRNKEALALYEQQSQETISPYLMPGHFQRNWLAYTATTVGTVAALTLIYKNQETLKAWYSTAETLITDYWKKNVLGNQEAVKIEEKTLENLIENNRKREREITQQKLQKPQKSWLEWSKEWFSKRAWVQWGADQVDEAAGGRKEPLDIRPPYTEEEAREEAKLAVEKGDLSRTEKDIEIQMHNTLLNIVNGRLLSNIFVVMQQKNVILSRILFLLDLTVKGLALIPPYLLAKSIYTSVTNSISKKTSMKLMKDLHAVHKIFNKYTKEDTFSWIDRGLLQYWITELKKHTIMLPVNEQQILQEDVYDLQSNTLTTEQKKEVIQRMFVTYGFLKPSNG